ncbi:hypothetical protein [Micromonospora sp. CPCC 205558]|uniref:hypothetical protein n=1 Tax=Micromonospora sp. CPCC 205558 TaxID=3122403 RepID=UPI002FEE7ED7
MSATTPLWVPLLVACLGLLGTIGAAVLTHAWTARRETVRWERELAERDGERNREERARWLAERRTLYSDFKNALDDFITKVNDGHHLLASTGKRWTPEAEESADASLTQCEALYRDLQMLAPIHLTADAEVLLEMYRDRFHGVMHGETAPLPVQRAAEVTRSLREKMREDLGIADGD